MENKHRIANLKSILRASRKDVRLLRVKAREAGSRVIAAINKSVEDPAHSHLYISEIGLAVLEMHRLRNAANCAQNEISKLRAEIKDLLAK